MSRAATGSDTSVRALLDGNASWKGACMQESSLGKHVRCDYVDALPRAKPARPLHLVDARDPRVESNRARRSVLSHDDETAARRVLEERVAHLEKMESVGRLAGGIAHDFNNLLTAILGFTEVLLADRPAAHPDRPHLAEIQK